MRRDVDLAPGALAQLLLLALPMAAFGQGSPCAAGPAGMVVERSFERHIALDAGCEYLFEAEQVNADVVLSVLDPAQRLIVRVDAPTGRIGEERVLFRAEHSGTYALRMEPRSPQGSWGRIEWRLSPVARTPPAARSAMVFETQAAAQHAAATQSSREDAAKLYRLALDSLRSAGSKPDLVRTQLELGWLEYTWMENWEEAARLADGARTLAGSADSPQRVSATLLSALARLESAQTVRAISAASG